MKLYSSRTKRQPVFGRRLITGALFLCVAFIAFLIYTETVNAGLISFVNSAFLGTIEASADVQSAHTGLTTETMTLLSAHANINPTSDLALEIAPVDDGEALSPDIASIDATSTDTGSQTISTYVVRSGDTLSEIAEMFNVSVNTILWANDISRTAPLQPGQTLIILPVSGINYTVKSGDTIQGVVSKYKADINEVLRFNDLLLGSKLRVGQTIIIPDAELSTPDVVANPHPGTGHILRAPNEPLLEGWNWPALPGYFKRPIVGGVKTQGLHGHNAVDLAAPIGTPIHAAADGTVIIARNSGWNGGYGNFVVISHPNGTQTLYAHMSRTAVSPGEIVSQGQTIGFIGMTGLTTGPHVHFEVRGAQNPF